MNNSTSDIIKNVFNEYKPMIVKSSVSHKDTENILDEMYDKLQNKLSSHYYQNVFKFVSSVDIDDVLSSSPPREDIVRQNDNILRTPVKKR